MANTMWFVQCEDCEHCTEAVIGYCCDKHSISIDNPKTDGCTWGNLKEKEYDAMRCFPVGNAEADAYG